MKDILPELEVSLKNFLQKSIKFKIDNKIVKTGKLILFSQNHYNLIFTLKNKNKNVTYKIPIPFDFSLVNDKLILNYKISTFTKNNKTIENILSRIKKKTYSKLYNKNLEISDLIP